MPRKANPLPDIEKLHAMFALADDGRIINKVSPTSRRAGTFADVHMRRGYRTVYCGRLLFAHRVVWALAFNEAPPENIDHVDGDILNNRPDNLRAASHSQNMMNRKLRCDSTSGVKGVTHRKDTGLWRAYISIDGKRINLGQYDTCDEAKEVVLGARAEIHGEFAREV